MADLLVAQQNVILEANAQDMDAARGHISEVMLDRLLLTSARIAAMAQGIRQVAALPDPVGKALATHTTPGGLLIEKTAVPMGVVAIIYESRPQASAPGPTTSARRWRRC